MTNAPPYRAMDLLLLLITLTLPSHTKKRASSSDRSVSPLMTHVTSRNLASSTKCLGAFAQLMNLLFVLRLLSTIHQGALAPERKTWKINKQPGFSTALERSLDPSQNGQATRCSSLSRVCGLPRPTFIASRVPSGMCAVLFARSTVELGSTSLVDFLVVQGTKVTRDATVLINGNNKSPRHGPPRRSSNNPPQALFPTMTLMMMNRAAPTHPDSPRTNKEENLPRSSSFPRA